MPELSKKEMAALINMVWESLQAPTWTKDDLIAFGKAIFSKETLKSMGKADFEKIFPFLSQIAKSFAEKIDSVPASAQEKRTTEKEAKEEKIGPEDKTPIPAKPSAKVSPRAPAAPTAPTPPTAPPAAPASPEAMAPTPPATVMATPAKEE